MKSFDPDRELIRVVDDEEMSAEAFARMAKTAAVVRCEKCDRIIDHPGLDPKHKYTCIRCSEERMYKMKLRPRTFYRASKIPYVKKPKGIELPGSVILTGK